jgi:hypothetical protein
MSEAASAMRNELNKQSKEIENLQAKYQQRRIDEDISEKYDLAKIALQEAQVSDTAWCYTHSVQCADIDVFPSGGCGFDCCGWLHFLIRWRCLEL